MNAELIAPIAPDDRTVAIPQPRALPRAPAAPTQLAGPLPGAHLGGITAEPLHEFGFDAPREVGLNPLLDAAAPLLDVLVRLRTATTPDDPSALRERVGEHLRAFELAARERGQSPESVYAARYVLCTALDEVVLAHGWGQESAWATRNLLTTFHNEVSGGETFFRLLETLGHDPARNIELLELMYVLLSLGFEGRFRLQRNRRDALIEIRERVHRQIRTVRGEAERTLSPRWEGLRPARGPLAAHLPLWLPALLAALVLLAVYAGLSLKLVGGTEPVIARLALLGTEALVIEREAPSVKPPPPVVDLPALLADDIARGRVAIENRGARQAVRLRGDAVFAPASATVKPRFAPVINRIGKAIADVDGEALVTGHSDSTPISSARFESNFALSQARAEGVARALATHLDDPAKVQAEGRGDSQPRASNADARGRAINRRVEILVGYDAYRPEGRQP